MKNVFQIADFSAGSDHKTRLHNDLFNEKNVTAAFRTEEAVLSDSELDMAAGGKKIQSVVTVSRQNY